MTTEVNTAGWHAALEALTMDDPHPKGYIAGTTASRLSRALWAYEWARDTYPVQEEPDGSTRQELPKLGLARAAVLEMEASGD